MLISLRRQIIFLFIIIFFSCNKKECDQGKKEYDSRNYLGAIYIFNKCIESGDSLDVDILSLRGSSYQHVGQPDLALKDFEKSLTIRPNEINTLLNIGEVLFKLGKISESCEYTRKAYILDSTTSVINYNMGVCSFKFNDYDNSIYYFSKELDINPNYYKAIFFKAHALLMLGKIDSCIKEVNRGLNVKKYAYGYFVRGMAHFEMKEYEKALEDYSEAVALDNTSTEFYFKEAATLSVLNRHKEAIEACNKAITLDSLYAPAYYAKAVSYYFLGNEYLACSNYFRSVELDSTLIDSDFFKDCK